MYNQEIVKRVADADIQAFRKMYIDCAPAVYDCAYDILHDVVRSNMVVSRTFVDIFNFLPQLKKIRLFDEWVYRLTVYHADNLALEDFIRGSEKLETIWHEIIDELGAVEAKANAQTPSAAREETARRESSAMSINTEETNALYSRLREIEQETDAIHLEHFSKIEERPSNDEFTQENEELSHDRSAMEEEWTPILFPADDGRDSELHIHSDEKSSSLKAYRKTVLMPAAKIFSVAKREVTGSLGGTQKTAQDSLDQTNEMKSIQESPFNSAFSQLHDTIENSVNKAEEVEDKPEDKPEEKPEDTEAIKETVIEVNDYANSTIIKTAAMDVQFERFRSFLDETRTAPKATEPPSAEEPMQADQAQISAEEELRNAVMSHSMPSNTAPPRSKKKAVRIVAIVLGSVVFAILVALLLMAYGVLVTPTFLKGIVAVVITALQGLFAASLK